MAEAIISIEHGKLRGKIGLDIRGNKYYSFQGIPYAKPPLGVLRFKAPQPPEPWKTIKDATKEGSSCYSRHMIFQNIIGSEDCLYLNVYTPNIQDNATSTLPLKPVMVYVHGGAFIMGSGDSELYGPEFLMPEDVVLVTFNYRLGTLGFLGFDDPTLGATGNNALKDMTFALQWVQRNIHNFCGNRNNVTIFGESAGGASVHYLMLSPVTKGLFHRVIAQSGAALCGWSSGEKFAPELAKILGCSSTDNKEIFQFLRNVPVDKLFEAQEKLPNPEIKFGAIVEDPTAKDAFLTDTALNIISSGNYNAVPLMIGYTSREGMLFEIFSKTFTGKINLITDFENELLLRLNLPKGSEKLKKAGQKLKEFYYGNGEPSLENIDSYYLLHTDSQFLRPIYSSVKNHLETSTSPVFLYRFSVESTLNFYKKIGKIRATGVCHADDLGYLFKNFATPEVQRNSVEDISIRRITTLWANFARDGDPTPAVNDDLIDMIWKPAEKGKMHFIDIGENLTMGINPEPHRMAFWDEIFSLTPATAKL